MTILPPIKNEEKTTEPEPKEEQKKEDEKSKAPVEVQVLSKRNTTDGDKKEEGKVSLVLLNDKPASVNEEVYSKIKWIKDDFSIDNDKILGLSEEGLKKVKANKKLVIPEIENVTTIEKQAFTGLGLRVVEIPRNITLIEEEAFKDNGLTKVIINGKDKTIAGSAFGEELLNEYKKNEDDVFLYEFEGLEIGEEIVSDAVGASEPDDLKYFTFNGTAITGLTEEGKVYYKENHTMILPGVNPENQPITEIGDEAFYEYDRIGYIIDLGIRNVDFSNCVELRRVGKKAFRYSRIATIDLSICKNLEAIDESAFEGLHLNILNLSGLSNLKIIGEAAFQDNSLDAVDLSSLSSLEIIGDSAFSNNKVVIPVFKD